MSQVCEIQESPLKKARLDGDDANLVEAVEKRDSDSEEYDDSDLSDEEERQEYRRFCRQIWASDGFDIDFLPNLPHSIGIIMPMELFEGGLNWGWGKRIPICVEDTVRRNNSGTLKLLSDVVGDPTMVCNFVDDILSDPRVLKANIQGSMTFYITFEAASKKHGERRIYQVKLSDNIVYNEIVVHLLREKPSQSSGP